MAKMEGYPGTQRAVPVTVLRRSQTSRICTPGIIFSAVVVLTVASITAIIIAASIFSSESTRKPGGSVAQVFVLIAASISMAYILLHTGAMLKNEPVGTVRPPVVRIHGYCFIVARLAFMGWAIALIALSVIVSQQTVCLRATRECALQIADLVGSALAFISTGILMTGLETYHHPFHIPDELHIRRKIKCRVSSFGSEIFDSSTRTSAHDEESLFDEIQDSNTTHDSQIARKPVPLTESQHQSVIIPGEFPVSPPVIPKSVTKGWGEEWIHLVRDTSSNFLSTTDSLPSLSDCSSCTSVSDGSSTSSAPKRKSRARTVTPSSSISDLSRRSPLSTMRSIESPNVPIPAQVRYLPPGIGPSHEWTHSKSLTQPLPVAKTHTSRRRSSRRLVDGRVTKQQSMPASQSAPISRRTTLDMRIPGAFINYSHLNHADQMRLDEQARKTELETTAKIRGAHKVTGPVRLPEREFTKLPIPIFPYSKTQHRPQSSYSTTQMMDSFLDFSVFMETPEAEYWKSSKSDQHLEGKTAKLRPLSIGDTSPDLEIVWMEEMEDRRTG